MTDSKPEPAYVIAATRLFKPALALEYARGNFTSFDDIDHSMIETEVRNLLEEIEEYEDECFRQMGHPKLSKSPA